MSLVRSFTLSGSLLGGMPEEEFFESVWRSRFSFYRDAAAGLLELMPTLAEFEALLAGDACEEADLVRVLSFPPQGTPVVRSWASRRPGAGTQVLQREESLNLIQAERWFPALGSFATWLGRRFGARANMQLFWSPAGSGLRPHSDIHDSFVIQIEGRKHWRVTDVDPERPPPEGNAAAVLPPDAEEFELGPGDVLYKPSHAPHGTTTTEGPALSLTASIVTRTAHDVLLDLLRRRLAEEPSLRERLPLGDDAARSRLAAGVAELDKLLPSLEELERASES